MSARDNIMSAILHGKQVEIIRMYKEKEKLEHTIRIKNDAILALQECVLEKNKQIQLLNRINGID